MRGLLQDFRYAARVLRKRPGFSFLVVLVLALGIGANSALFSVVDAALLRPLPYPAPDRLVTVFSYQSGEPQRPNGVAGGDVMIWQTQARSFERLAAYRGTAVNLSAGPTPARIDGAVVSRQFFPLFGVTPQLGVAFGPDGASAEPRPVVISAGL